MTTSDRVDDTPDWDALARFRSGESAPAEASAVARWLAAHPADAAALDALDAVVAERLAVPPSARVPVDTEAALARVHQRIDAEVVPRPALRVARVLPRVVERPTRRWAYGGLAAAAAVAALVVGLRRDHGAEPAPATLAVAPEVHESAVGATDSVTLADGTRVLLGPGSRLTVASGFARGHRQVTLQGEARFTVRHDSASPFTVHAGDAVVRDVGTRFIVRAARERAVGVVVAVMEGEVTLAAAGRSAAPTALRPGDRAVLDSGGAVVATRGIALDDEEAWTRGILAFRNAPLGVVREEVRRWYGVDLQVADARVATRRLTATFEHESADQALRAIALALGATVERSGPVATLRAPAIAR